MKATSPQALSSTRLFRLLTLWTLGPSDGAFEPGASISLKLLVLPVTTVACVLCIVCQVAALSTVDKEAERFQHSTLHVRCS